jgi:ATPase subunit of ABC transporter with duplicated ATPase domains
MPSIVLSRVSFAHRDDVPLFAGVDLTLVPGWTGLVGANGAGKTTLLLLLARRIAPGSGDVRWLPPPLRVVLCPQGVEDATAEIARLAAAADGEARRWRGRLALETAQLGRWGTLSPGERKRWQVAAALAGAPDALLLDEPTNHLDAGARDLLVEALAEFRGIGLVVSHDRALLDALTTATLRIHGGRVEPWPGGYAPARACWDAAEREAQAGRARLRGEQERLAARLADTRRERARAESRMRTSKRMKSAKDSDARGRFKQKRRRSAEVRLGREIGKLHHRLERVGEALAEFAPARAKGRALFVDWAPAPLPRLAELRAAELYAGAKLVLRDVDVWVDRGTRVRVAGANGEGKTTLLGALVRAARVPDGRLLWLPQELEPGAGRALVASLAARARDERGRVLSFLAALGVDPERVLHSAEPSPGEARKLALADALARQVWALVLDEPTNHLDLPSIERLERCLADYPGALVLVTHDDALAARCTRDVWQLAGERIHSSGERFGVS